MAGSNFPGVKSPSDALDETRQPSITGLPACYRATLPPFVLFRPSFHVGSRGRKGLTAGVHGVCLSSGQAGDALAGSNFPGVKRSLLTHWMRPGNHSITGLPACYRATLPPFVLFRPSFHVGSRGRKGLTAGVHGVCLSSGQAGDALAGSNFPGVKRSLLTHWMRPGNHSITGLPACYRAGSLAFFYPYI